MDNREKQYIKLTQTPLEKLLIQLSIPTVISMLITSIYNMVDTAFVGKLGTSASGAVGVVFGFMAIIQAIAFMFGQGSGVVMARLQGKGDTEESSRVASLGFFWSIIVGLVLLALSMIFLDPLVRFLGSTETIAPYAKTYITFILIAAPAMIATFVLNTLLRYEGKAAMGMVGMLIGAVLNMGGDPIFMFVFKMGIAGAGLSTCLSQIISFLILLSFFLRGKTTCSLSFKHFSFDLPVLMEICETGFPSMVRQGLVSLSTTLLNREAGLHGDYAVAAMSIVSRISMFIFSIGLGICQGFQPISSFNYGAGKYTRVRKAFWLTVLYSEILITGMAIIVMIFSGSFVAVFRDDPEVISAGTRAMQLHSLSLILTPFGMAVEMMLQSTGCKVRASILSSLRNGLFFIPILLILSNLRGLAGIQEAQPAAYLVSVIPAAMMMVTYLRALPAQDA